ncbi:MAG TPA: rod shape-determining protein MreC [Geobacterales bacterium]|nr:rod shape-determining protein MreC [Geobacterales bacterium]
MSQFEQYDRKTVQTIRSLVWAVVILFAVFIFFSLNLRRRFHANIVEQTMLRVTAPVQRFTTWSKSNVDRLWNDYLFLVGVEEHNRLLLEQNRRLNGRVIENNELVLAGDRLRQLLALKNTLPMSSMAATVIGEDSAPWKILIIDRGEADGVREGMPVVATAGVVGQVIKVAPHTSRVLLLTDGASAVAITIQRSRARGVLHGKGDDNCSIDFSLREEDVQVGDIVVTSGMGGIFPKGVPVGEVTMVTKGEYRIFQSVEVRPYVNLSRLEEVLVLLRERNS